MTGHELAKRLLELPDTEVIAEGLLVINADTDSYDEGNGDVPCISLGTE